MSIPLDLHERVLQMGKESLALIQNFLSKRISREDFSPGIAELAADEVLSRYWDELTADAECIPYWQVLLAIKGMAPDLEYQLGEYGESTLYDDLRDIALNLQRIANQHQAAEKRN